MGRTVADTAMLLSTMAGYDPKMPHSFTGDSARFAEALYRDFKGIRIGWLGDLGGYLPTEKGVMGLCESALDGFRDIGCEVELTAIDYSMAELWQCWLVFRHWMVADIGGPLYQNPETRKLLKAEMIWEIEGATNFSATDISTASAARYRWYQALLAAFTQYDYLVLPSAQVFPFDAGIHWPTEISGKQMDTYHRWMEITVPGNTLGLSGGKCSRRIFRRWQTHGLADYRARIRGLFSTAISPCL